jgi:hypothetical protein
MSKSFHGHLINRKNNTIEVKLDDGTNIELTATCTNSRGKCTKSNKKCVKGESIGGGKWITDGKVIKNDVCPVGGMCGKCGNPIFCGKCDGCKERITGKGQYLDVVTIVDTSSGHEYTIIYQTLNKKLSKELKKKYYKLWDVVSKKSRGYDNNFNTNDNIIKYIREEGIPDMTDESTLLYREMRVDIERHIRNANILIGVGLNPGKINVCLFNEDFDEIKYVPWLVSSIPHDKCIEVRDAFRKPGAPLNYGKYDDDDDDEVRKLTVELLLSHIGVIIRILDKVKTVGWKGLKGIGNISKDKTLYLDYIGTECTTPEGYCINLNNKICTLYDRLIFWLNSCKYRRYDRNNKATIEDIYTLDFGDITKYMRKKRLIVIHDNIMIYKD